MSIYFTSDQHWNHKNVLKFENRPYDTVEEMNEGLIVAWNKVVKHNDTVHHLGDFCFGGYDKWVSILDRLNGKIILYKGNHDKSNVLKRLAKDGYFEEMYEVGNTMKVNKMDLWLTHYPMDIGLRPRKYSISGHIHNQKSRLLNQVNIGVDSHLKLVKSKPFGTPILLEELIDYLNETNPQVEEMFLAERKK